MKNEVDNELKLYYHGGKQRDKEVLGYAESLEDHKLNDKNIADSPLTERQIAEIASDLEVGVSDLIDKNEELYIDKVKSGDFSDEELLKIMVRNPELIQTPIAYMNDQVFIVKSQYSLINEDIEVNGVKSSEGNKFEK